MNPVLTLLSEQTIHQIGWALVSFVWQGCAAAAMTWIVLKWLRNASSNTRYTAACTGLALTALAPIITYLILKPHETTQMQPIGSAVSVSQVLQLRTQAAITETPVAAALPEKSAWKIAMDSLEAALPYCVIGWFAGVAGLSLWYLGGWCQLQKLRWIGTKSVCSKITDEAANLVARLEIHRVVRIAESALVQVPTMIGWLKPVILLPTTALTGLDEIQLRAVIAHELAHVRRYDYVVNMIQTAIEIAGFYHPCVWWISRQIRVERENCCDDIAAGLIQDRTGYARALFSMEELRVRQTALAMAASGGSLTDRIGRLIGKKTTENQKTGWIPPAAIAIILPALIAAAGIAQQPTGDVANKEDIAAFLQQVQTAIETRDVQSLEKFFFFEDEVYRQKAMPFIQDLSFTQLRQFRDVHILRVDRQGPARLNVFGLFPVSNGPGYAALTIQLITTEKKPYRINLFTEEALEQLELRKTHSAEQIALQTLQKQLSQWQTANADELRQLIADSISQRERDLDAMSYAEKHQLMLLPYASRDVLTEQLNQLRTMDPEALRNMVVAESAAGLKKMEANASSNPIDVLRLKSMNALKLVGMAYALYAADYADGRQARSWADLKPYLDAETHTWAVEHIELLWQTAFDEPQNPAALPLAYDRTFLQQFGQRLIVFMDGYVEADSNNQWKETLDKAIRLSHMSKMKLLGMELILYADKNGYVFPDRIEQLEQSEIKNWAAANVRYLAGGRKITEIEQPMLEVVAYDQPLLDGTGSTNILFADGHVEYRPLSELNTLLQKQGVIGIGGMGGGIIMNPEDLAPAIEGTLNAGGMGGGIITFEESGLPADVHGMGGFGVVSAAPQIDPNLEDQICIEARFIMADDSLLENVGIQDFHVTGNVITGFADSDQIKTAMQTRSLAEWSLPNETFQTIDDGQAALLLQAAQNHKSTKMLSAPKAVVLNNESARIEVKTTHRYSGMENTPLDVDTGVELEILPAMQGDEKNILLKTDIQLTDILESHTQSIDGKEHEIPWMQVTDIKFETTVGSGRTIIIVGPELTSSRSESTKPRLCILLKPTIIAASR